MSRRYVERLGWVDDEVKTAGPMANRDGFTINLSAPDNNSLPLVLVPAPTTQGHQPQRALDPASRQCLANPHRRTRRHVVRFGLWRGGNTN